MAKVIAEDVGAYYHHYPRVACIITSHAGDRDDAMAAAWHTPISFTPPLFGVAIAAKRFSYQLITASREFGVCFLPFTSVEIIAAVGGVSGRDADKFHRFNIATEKGIKTQVPLLKAAYTSYECRLVDDRAYGDHRLLVGEVVAVHRQAEAFDAEEVIALAKFSPALYLGDERYIPASADGLKHLEREAYGTPK
jgi:flavin reductase (DIM6/NTAB) family NADH-FMN oxidoreductase RutF